MITEATLFKILNGQGVPIYGAPNFRWSLPERRGRPGEWVEVKGKLVMCKHGLHLSTFMGLGEWWMHMKINRIYIAEAELSAGVLANQDKIVCRRARLLRDITPNLVVLKQERLVMLRWGLAGRAPDATEQLLAAMNRMLATRVRGKYARSLGAQSH